MHARGLVSSPFLIGALLTLAAPCLADVVVERTGRISGFDIEGDVVSVDAGLLIPMEGWGEMLRQEPSGVSESSSPRPGVYTSVGSIPVGEGRFVYTSTVEVEGSTSTVEIEVRSETTRAIEGVYYWVHVPTAAFAGGACILSLSDGGTRGISLPVTPPPVDERHIASGEALGVRLEAPGGDTVVSLAYADPLGISVQDDRVYGGGTFSIYAPIHRGTLAPGETAKATITISVEHTPNRDPAALAVYPDQALYELDGFGGNYCFNLESPVTDYTLDTLNVRWARTEATLDLWEPENDNADPATVDWERLRASDREGSELHDEFLMHQRIERMGIPYCVSVWHPPGWPCEDPEADRWRGNRRIARANWPELVECVGTYLEYAKREYGVEPDLFSFNEANIGVMLLIDGEEHRDLIKAIGADLERRGLKTKMLLGDVGSARGSIGFTLPTADDPEALPYVGAVAFHSWGGASPEEYGAWRDLARRLGVPLLVTELGVDAQAYRDESFHQYQYAVEEARMYQELLLHAQPQGTMQWEFTGDYALGWDRNGKVEPTPRYWFVRHFCNLTPTPAEVLATTSDSPRVLVTAFRGETADGPALVLHILNDGAARKATLTGLPEGLTSLAVTLSGRDHALSDMGEVAVTNGTLELDLPVQSLVTLRAAWR